LAILYFFYICVCILTTLPLLLLLLLRLEPDQNGKKESALHNTKWLSCALPVALLPIYTQERLISIDALKKPAWQILERKRIGIF
jgi:hypothetical protein